MSQGRMSAWSRSQVMPMVATGVVLLGLLGDRVLLRTPPPEAESYHRSVRAAALAIPDTFGPWLGIDCDVPEAAVQMLHPNVIISRRYKNIVSGQSVTLLLVHVKDARDLLGHYPPVCYPGQGWKTQSVNPVKWESARPLDGIEYRFERDHIEGGSRIVIDNFFIMRGGAICRTMDEVEEAATHRHGKFYGAAQVQFVHDADVSPEKRRAAEGELLKVMEAAFAAISAEGQA